MYRLVSMLSHRCPVSAGKITHIIPSLVTSDRNMLFCKTALIRHFCNDFKVAPASRKKNISQTKAALPLYDFDIEAKKALIAIKKAIEPMLAVNQYYLDETDSQKLSLEVGSKGSYSFRIDHNLSRIVYRSPISGSLQYEYSPEEKQWLSVNDGHDLRGIIVRDLIRHSIGMPQFEDTF